MKTTTLLRLLGTVGSSLLFAAPVLATNGTPPPDSACSAQAAKVTTLPPPSNPEPVTISQPSPLPTAVPPLFTPEPTTIPEPSSSPAISLFPLEARKNSIFRAVDNATRAIGSSPVNKAIGMTIVSLVAVSSRASKNVVGAISTLINQTASFGEMLFGIFSSR